MPDTPPPDGWEWTLLSDVAQLESGHTPSRKHPEYWDGPVPWIGIKDATGNHGRTIYDTIQHVTDEGLANSSARLLPANTVCLSRTASVGYVVVMGRPMATSQDFVNWICGPDIDHQFLKYVLLAEKEALLRFASGTTHQTIYYPEAKAFHLCLPRLAEQKRIAHILGTLDDKIELNRRMNATLEAMSRAIFKSWFVDFEPVRQKAAGKQPVGMDAKTAALFPDSFGDSEIGEVPKGWRFGSILEQASLLSGGTPKTDEPSFWGGSIPWASAKDVSQCSDAFLATTERTVTQAGVDNSSTKIIAANTTVIVSRGATTGRLTMLAHDMAMNQTCYGLQSRFGTPFSLYCCTRSFIDRMVAAAHGSVFDTITTRTFEATPVLLVPLPTLEIFEANVASTFAQVRNNVLHSQSLAALRDTLLPKLLSGEVRVPEAERLVEEAVG
jgi:type I restriction enzyme S subunit